MGQLADGFRDWVTAMNRNPSNQTERAQQNSDLQAAQDRMIAGLLGDLDEVDQVIHGILRAFDRSQHG